MMDFCIKNDEFRKPWLLSSGKRTASKTDKFGVKNEKLCIKNEETCIKMMTFADEAERKQKFKEDLARQRGEMDELAANFVTMRSTLKTLQGERIQATERVLASSRALKVSLQWKNYDFILKNPGSY